MLSRAEKLIEGFKLGSLGVSKKPKVTIGSDEPQAPKVRDRRDDIRIIHEVVASQMTPNPLILWEDFDKLLYMLELTTHDSIGIRPSPLSAVWFLQISCATPAPPGADNGKHNWLARSKLNTVKGLKKKYEKYLAIIKEKGIDGLLNSGTLKAAFRPDAVDQLTYHTWLGKKESGEL
jgi:hypothetical protein